MSNVSIFNSVLSPVAHGPSAGCTGGSIHIGRIGRRLLGEKPVNMRVQMSPKGAYPLILTGMRNDVGLIHGMLGRDLTDERFMEAFDAAREEGLETSFEFTEEVPADRYSLYRIHLTGESGRKISMDVDSVGGGNVELISINGCPLLSRALAFEVLLFCEKAEPGTQEELEARIREICPAVSEVSRGQGEKQDLWHLKSPEACTLERLEALRTLLGARELLTMEPEFPVVSGNGTLPPFNTPAEMVEYLRKTGGSLYDAALAYESAVSSWSSEQVAGYAEELWSVVETEIAHGTQGGFDLYGVVPSRIAEVKAGFENKNWVNLGAAGQAAADGLSIMEHSSGTGVIVGAPTGGSAGLMPAAIRAAALSLGKDRSEMAKALLVAGLMGVFMAEGDFDGAYGCQAEIGCGAAMAAGAVVYLQGGTAQQACDAASTALQCLLGLICNTLCGIVQVPCYIRNMALPAVSMICATAVMSGLDCPIPLEEICRYMYQLGRRMLASGCNPCSGHGTPTGKRLDEKFWKKETEGAEGTFARSPGKELKGAPAP